MNIYYIKYLELYSNYSVIVYNLLFQSSVFKHVKIDDLNNLNSIILYKHNNEYTLI